MTRPGEPFSYHRNTQILSNGALVIGGAAILAGMLFLSPSFILLKSILGIFFLLCVGAVCGVTALTLCVVAAWHAVSQKLNEEVSIRGTGIPPFNADPRISTQHYSDEERQRILAGVREEALQQQQQAEAPPHPFVANGLYSGWIWTVVPSTYDRTQALAQWPPATEGPKAIARKWWGSLKGQSLYLVLQVPEAEKGADAPVVEVVLTGCSVNIVTEGLKTKTRWWRKTPLEITHTSRKILGGETSMIFFAIGGAAKEQWFTALTRAISGGGTAAGVEAMYSLYCRHLRALKQDVYPEPSKEEEETSTSGAAEGEAPKEGSRRWGRFWGRRSPGAKARPSPKGKSLRHVNTAPADPSAAAVAADKGFVNPFDLDELWMGHGGKNKSANSKHVQLEAAMAEDASKEGDEPSAGGDGGSTHGGELSARSSMESARKEVPGVVGRSKSAPAKAKAVNAAAPETKESLQASESGLSSGTEGQSGSPSAHGGSQNAATFSVSGVEAASEGGLWPEGGPSELPSWKIEDAVNMLIARVGFDLLRSPTFQGLVHAHVQKKLNDLRIPSFMHGMNVVEVKVGSTVPVIKNVRAMPVPTAAMWPQILCDFEFDGDVTVLVETKVDVRDAATWNHVESIINRIDGSGTSTPLRPSESASALGASVNTTETGSGKQEDEDYDDEEEEEEHATGSSGSGQVTVEDTPLASSETTAAGRARRKLLTILPLRKHVANRIRKLADVAAERISGLQLRLVINIKALRGPVCVWIPPPPGDRLWFSFMTIPQLIAEARPIVGGRLLKYSYQTVTHRVSQWIVSKLQRGIAKNLVFPSCSDLRLPFLLPIDHPDALAAIPLSEDSVAKEVDEHNAKQPDKPVGGDASTSEGGKEALPEQEGAQGAGNGVVQLQSDSPSATSQPVETKHGKADAAVETSPAKPVRRGPFSRRSAAPKPPPAPTGKSAATAAPPSAPPPMEMELMDFSSNRLSDSAHLVPTDAVTPSLSAPADLTTPQAAQAFTLSSGTPSEAQSTQKSKAEAMSAPQHSPSHAPPQNLPLGEASPSAVATPSHTPAQGNTDLHSPSSSVAAPAVRPSAASTAPLRAEPDFPAPDRPARRPADSVTAAPQPPMDSERRRAIEADPTTPISDASPSDVSAGFAHGGMTSDGGPPHGGVSPRPQVRDVDGPVAENIEGGPLKVADSVSDGTAVPKEVAQGSSAAAHPDTGMGLRTGKGQDRGVAQGTVAGRNAPGSSEEDVIAGEEAFTPLPASLPQTGVEKQLGKAGSEETSGALTGSLGDAAGDGGEGGEGEEYFSLLEGILARSRSGGSLSSKGFTHAPVGSSPPGVGSPQISPVSGKPVSQGSLRTSQGGEPTRADASPDGAEPTGTQSVEGRGLEAEPQRVVEGLEALGRAVGEEVSGLGFGIDKQRGLSGDRAHFSPESQASADTTTTATGPRDVDTGTPDVSGGLSGLGNSYTFPASPSSHSIGSDTEGSEKGSTKSSRRSRLLSLGAAGAAKGWEVFQKRNPNAVEQGKKLVGSLATQAEHLRSTTMTFLSKDGGDAK